MARNLFFQEEIAAAAATGGGGGWQREPKKKRSSDGGGEEEKQTQLVATGHRAVLPQIWELHYLPLSALLFPWRKMAKRKHKEKWRLRKWWNDRKKKEWRISSTLPCVAVGYSALRQEWLCGLLQSSFRYLIFFLTALLFFLVEMKQRSVFIVVVESTYKREGHGGNKEKWLIMRVMAGLKHTPAVRTTGSAINDHAELDFWFCHYGVWNIDNIDLSWLDVV